MSPSGATALDYPRLKIDGFTCGGTRQKPVCNGVLDGTDELELKCTFKAKQAVNYICTAPGERGRPNYYTVICAFKEPSEWVCPRAG